MELSCDAFDSVHEWVVVVKFFIFVGVEKEGAGFQNCRCLRQILGFDQRFDVNHKSDAFGIWIYPRPARIKDEFSTTFGRAPRTRLHQCQFILDFSKFSQSPHFHGPQYRVPKQTELGPHPLSWKIFFIARPCIDPEIPSRSVRGRRSPCNNRGAGGIIKPPQSPATTEIVPKNTPRLSSPPPLISQQHRPPHRIGQDRGQFTQ